MALDDPLCLAGFLGPIGAADLQRAADAAFAVHSVDGVALPTIDLGGSFGAIADRLRCLAPMIRSEIDVGHFIVGGVSAVLSRHASGDGRCDLVIESEALGSPRIAFVYTFGSTSDDASGALRVVGGDGSSRHEFEPVDDQLVVFPADRHHEVASSSGPAELHRFSITGFVTGAALHDTPVLDREIHQGLQQHLLPRLTDHGYEVRPIPDPMHDLLAGMLEIRRGRMRVEPSDPSSRPTGDADYVDLGDLSGDIMRWLQPMHERFAGMPLTPSNIYGIRRYRPGNTLEMHLDRPEALIVSSVVQIEQDVDEPWPLVIERDGRRDEVFLEPGQMLLYEGATCSHGRPTPLRGRSFANLFVHYRPTDWTWDRQEIARLGVADGLIDVFGRPTDRFPAHADA